MMRSALIAATMLALPASAGTFKPPPGCRLEVTVQNRGCTVGQQFRCETDPKGWQRLALFTEGGLTHLSVIDEETRWIESTDPETGLIDMLDEDSPDHASFSTLIETGRDDFDFWTESNGGERLRHIGHDELTGETVSIDGVELDVTRFDVTTTSEAGQVLIERSGQQYISRAFGRFYGGVEHMSDWTGENSTTDDSPITFSFPGEPGFGETIPQFDCNMMMTQLSQGKAAL